MLDEDDVDDFSNLRNYIIRKDNIKYIYVYIIKDSSILLDLMLNELTKSKRKRGRALGMTEKIIG